MVLTMLFDCGVAARLAGGGVDAETEIPAHHTPASAPPRAGISAVPCRPPA